MLDKTFNPQEVEKRHYEKWEAAGAFSADPHSSAPPYTIMMPPPNVTGNLHMGHALTFTLQDILVRYHRMIGRDVLWQPGTDHAGIATQMVVERELAREGKTRVQLGRESFLERVWAWKAESGNAITRQLRRLGATPDWPRERFTLDEGLSRAVRKVFVDLHRQGLIYRDKRLVNWDPKLHTAISDLEVQQRQAKGHLWHLRYPIEGSDGKFIVVATTRPETLLGDTAVAVHPEDERYRHLIGQRVMVPLVDRSIPIVGDDYADPETGSGAVKITPAHDFNDFEVGRRHQLPMINVFDKDAKLNENTPPSYRGLDRYAAREKIVADIAALGLLERVEDHDLTLPYGDRSGEVIEPWLTDQWYCDAKTLAKPALEAVEQGRTIFVPKQWENTFFDWMRNIQPWCISRQLWWGHRIPAWYGPDGAIFVAMSEEEAQAQAKNHYGKETAITQDNDVLDTWFSSALWPFSTLGWPQETPELRRYYPGNVLVTGFDIIFFWVARMMMMGLHFMGEVPFRTVYIHALIRDEHGQKMSKSKGNVIDPLELIDKYGCDALRFTLTALAAQGRDIRMSESRVEGYRNFATKLWNAARYAMMNECRLVPNFDPKMAQETVNRWIIGRLVMTEQAIEKAFQSFRFNDAALALYQFIWGEFCDWYLEFTKPILLGGEEGAKSETRATTAWVLAKILHLLHPFMPFITEELWDHIGEGGDLIGAAWPDLPDALIDSAAIEDFDWLMGLIGNVRALRVEMNVSPAAQVPLFLRDADRKTVDRLERYRDFICRLARAEKVEILKGESPKGAAQLVIGEATLLMPLEGIIDVAQERQRLQKELDRTIAESRKIEQKLGNEQFLAKAKPEIIDEQRERLADCNLAISKFSAALERLAAL